MPEGKQIFEQYYNVLLQIAHDHNISLGISRSVNAYRERRARALEKFPHTVKLAEEVRQLKEDCIGRLDDLVQKATASLKENGAQVYHAESASDALEIIGDIVGSGKVILSGKTLTGEEIGLRQYLQNLDNEFWETDTGELIQQLRGEKPLHYLCPSPHVSREQVAELLTNLLHREVSSDVSMEVRTIREFLRSKYFEADFGISGCNVLAADTGSVILLESECNIRLLTSVAPVHIVLVGIDKVVPTFQDALKVAEVAWRYGGFVMPLYISAVSGPSATGDIEYTMVQGASGPLQLHVVFLDNGRRTLAQDPILREALYCLKCGGCLFECPIFQLAAGYYGGRGYFGGVGAILVAYMSGGFSQAAPIAYTCLRCGRCTEFCPQSIDLSKLIAELRHRIVES